MSQKPPECVHSSRKFLIFHAYVTTNFSLNNFQSLDTAAGRHDPAERPGHQEPDRDPVRAGEDLRGDAELPRRRHGPLGRQGGASGDQGREASCPAAEGHGCRSRGCQRSKS